MRDDGLRARYWATLRSEDAAERAVAAELLRRLDRAAGQIVAQSRHRTTTWGHVGGADLLAHLGASGAADRGTRVQGGHDWAHGSRSGACLVLWPTEGRWWCSSCRRTGDVVALVRDALGLGYDAAVTWLVARYGPPTGGLSRRRRPPRYDPAVRSVVLIGGHDE
jgi:hypothetical protein